MTNTDQIKECSCHYKRSVCGENPDEHCEHCQPQKCQHELIEESNIPDGGEDIWLECKKCGSQDNSQPQKVVKEEIEVVKNVVNKDTPTRDTTEESPIARTEVLDWKVKLRILLANFAMYIGEDDGLDNHEAEIKKFEDFILSHFIPKGTSIPKDEVIEKLEIIKPVHLPTCDWHKDRGCSCGATLVNLGIDKAIQIIKEMI